MYTSNKNSPFDIFQRPALQLEASKRSYVGHGLTFSCSYFKQIYIGCLSEIYTLIIAVKWRKKIMAPRDNEQCLLQSTKGQISNGRQCSNGWLVTRSLHIWGDNSHTSTPIHTRPIIYRLALVSNNRLVSVIYQYKTTILTI